MSKIMHHHTPKNPATHQPTSTINSTSLSVSALPLLISFHMPTTSRSMSLPRHYDMSIYGCLMQFMNHLKMLTSPRQNNMPCVTLE